MKLIRFGDWNKERAGIMIDEGYYDVSGLGADYDEQFFETGGIERLRQFVEKNRNTLPEIGKGVRLGSPVCRPSKIICIGLNYEDHARETNAAIPPEPIIFFKSTTSLCGPFDEVILPKNSKKTDWEVELAVVIGKRASYVEESQAAEYIAGYCLHNDLSEREFQLERNGQWVKGKSCDTFAPLGPLLVTPDEMTDAGNLRLWLTVNGKTRQDSNTANLIFKIPFLISYVSQFMTLLAGDIISTGTPPGVGLGMTPPQFLKAGDVMELGITGLGISRQRVRNYSAQ